MSRVPILIVLAGTLLCSACERRGSDTTADAQYEQYVRDYAEQLERVSEQQRQTSAQIDESAELLSRQKALLDNGEEIVRRQAALLELQEQQAQRFNAVLDKWEAAETR